MGDYHKIAVKNVAIVNICFRKEGMMYNEGRIVLDIDTYDFAGRITDDVIVGYYENDMYHIHYYYNIHSVEIDPMNQDNVETFFKEYHLEFLMEFQRDCLPDDFLNKVIRTEDYSITFVNMEDDIEMMKRTLEYNLDLLIGRL